MARALSSLTAIVLAVGMPLVAHAEPEEINSEQAQTQPATPLPTAPGPLVLAPPVARPAAPVRRSPAAVKEFGWNAGLGLGAAVGGPQLFLLSAYAFRVAAQAMSGNGSAPPGILGGLVIGGIGVVAVGLGITESVVGGLYYRNHVRLRPGGGEAGLRGAWRAGTMKGAGMVLLLHGALNLVTCGAVLWAAQNRDLGTMTRSLRDISIAGVAVGGLDVIIGGSLVIVGQRWTFDPSRVALLPAAVPGGAGVMLGGSF